MTGARKKSSKKRAPGAGRPLTGTERKVRYNVMMTPADEAWLRELGNGNRSAGIEEVRRRLQQRDGMGE